MSRKYNRPWLTNGLHIERVPDEEIKTVLSRKAEIHGELLSKTASASDLKTNLGYGFDDAASVTYADEEIALARKAEIDREFIAKIHRAIGSRVRVDGYEKTCIGCGRTVFPHTDDHRCGH